MCPQISKKLRGRAGGPLKVAKPDQALPRGMGRNPPCHQPTPRACHPPLSPHPSIPYHDPMHTHTRILRISHEPRIRPRVFSQIEFRAWKAPSQLRIRNPNRIPRSLPTPLILSLSNIARGEPVEPSASPRGRGRRAAAGEGARGFGGASPPRTSEGGRVGPTNADFPGRLLHRHSPRVASCGPEPAPACLAPLPSQIRFVPFLGHFKAPRCGCRACPCEGRGRALPCLAATTCLHLSTCPSYFKPYLRRVSPGTGRRKNAFAQFKSIQTPGRGPADAPCPAPRRRPARSLGCPMPSP